MKFFHVLLVSSVMMMGCAHQDKVEHPRQQYQPTEYAMQSQDNFAKAGDMIADSSRWVYNKSTQAWQAVVTEENKQYLIDKFHSAKDYVHSLTDK